MTKIGPTVLAISVVVATTLVTLRGSVQAATVTFPGPSISAGEPGTQAMASIMAQFALVGESIGGTGSLSASANALPPNLGGANPGDVGLTGSIDGLTAIPPIFPFLVQVRNTPGPLADQGPITLFIPSGQQLDIPLAVSATLVESAAIPGTLVAGSSTLVLSVPPGLSLEPVPLPAALPLFGAGLGALGLLGWRRRRKPA